MLVELENRPGSRISELREIEEVDHAPQDLKVNETPQSKFLEFYGTIHETWNTSSTVALYGMNENGLHHYWTLQMIQKKNGMRIRKWGRRNDR
jgi:hypothetical protein